MKNMLAILSVWFFPLNSFASIETDSLSSIHKTSTLKKDGKYFRDKTIIPVPIIFRLPETGFAFGALVSATFRFTKDSINSKPSQVSFGGAYTQKKQVLIDLPFSVFCDNNRYYLNGEIAWYRYSYKYFGIGENQVAEEQYEVDYPRVKILATKLIGKNLYGGFRYLYEDYKITSTEVGKELANGNIAGSKRSYTSSLGVSLLKDSRDVVFYPKKGVFGEFYVLPTLKIFGADRNFNRIVLDLASYKSLTKKIVWANNLYGSFLQGKNIPFSQLSLLGGNKKMRGLFEGRFRDKNLLLLQTETRFELNKLFGFVAFASLGYLGDDKNFIRLEKPKFSYGGGLRITAIRKEHINIRIDYGIMPKEKGNFYLTVGEAF